MHTNTFRVFPAGEPEESSHGPRPPSAASLSGISGDGLAAGGPGSPSSAGVADGVAKAAQGPRIFVGKLPKGTVEEDVKQYFMQCAAKPWPPVTRAKCISKGSQLRRVERQMHSDGICRRYACSEVLWSANHGCDLCLSLELVFRSLLPCVK